MQQWIRNSILFVALAAMLLTPRFASAQALADRVPEDAIFYFGWRGTADLGPGYNGSELKSLLDDSHVREVINDVLPRVMMTIDRAQPDAKQVTDVLRVLAPSIWKFPTAVYFTAMMPGRQPVMHAAIYCRAGADAANLQRTVDQLLDQAGNHQGINTAVVDDVFVLAFGFQDAAQAIAGAETSKPLSGKAEFTNALSRCTSEPNNSVFTMYFDAQAGLALGEQAIAQSQDAQLHDLWPKIRDGLGLAGFHRLVVTSGFDGKLWSDRAFVEAPLPRTGLMAMFDAPPLTGDELKIVPSTATSASTTTFNLAKFITDARNTVAGIDADAGVKFDQGLSVVQMYVGKSLVRDILAPLGSTWVCYQDPAIAGPGFASMTLVNKLQDPAKAVQGLNALAIAINNTLNGFLRPHNIEIVFRQAKIGDQTVNYLAIPLFAPSWTVKDGLLYVSLFPQTCATAAARGNGGKPVTENPSFTAIKSSLATDHASSFSFLDLPQVAPTGYSSLLVASRLFVGTADIFGGRSIEPVVPSLAVLMKHVSPSGAVGWSDEQGFYAKSLSPFPGADLLNAGGSDGLIYLLSTLPQSIAPFFYSSMPPHVAMTPQIAPAPFGGGPDEEQKHTMANLRSIGQYVMINAADSKGALPASIPDVVKHYSAGHTEIIHSPFATDPSAEDDYAYLGNATIRLPKIKSAATTMLAYDAAAMKQENATAVLFVDGHVEWLPGDRVQTLIDDARQKGLGGGL